MEFAISKLARDGSEALTFRAVAREMNIAVGAFSRYFKSLSELEDAMAARIISMVVPPNAGNEKGLREELLRLCLDWLAVTRTYPALVTFGGPASATALAGHVGQVVKVMADAGIDLERAILTYGMVINLAYAWGVQVSRQSSRKIQKKSIQAFTRQAGGLTPQLAKLFEASDTEKSYRQSIILLLDGLLPAMPSRNKR